MSAAPTSEQVAAMRVAEWRGEAKLSGVPFHDVALRSIRARLNVSRPLLLSAEKWLDIPPVYRGLLLTWATDRRVNQTDVVRWDQLTQDEQRAVGVLARDLVRHLKDRAGWLR